MTSLTIGKVARQAGVNVETIRYYERRGLIEQPPRADRSVREYSPEVVQRVCFIREAKKLGFSLQEVTELLALRADPETNCDDVRVKAEAKRDEVNEKIRKLKNINNVLDQMIDDCPKKGNLSSCPILTALDNPN